MTVAGTAAPTRNPFERLFAALIDPTRCKRTMLVLLAGYAAAWSLYGTIAKGSQDLHFDIGEMFAWSHQVSLSAPTHPPLGAWLTGAWFAVMPRQDWAFYLFGILTATVALWIAWRLAGRYLTPEKRILGIALLSLLPFYSFHALKFNASSVLTPFWAATTWWFLLSFETRRAGWAAIAGLAAGAAMLGKYWSIFLLAGLGLAALTDPRRAASFLDRDAWFQHGKLRLYFACRHAGASRNWLALFSLQRNRLHRRADHIRRRGDAAERRSDQGYAVAEGSRAADNPDLLCRAAIAGRAGCGAGTRGA